MKKEDWKMDKTTQERIMGEALSHFGLGFHVQSYDSLSRLSTLPSRRIMPNYCDKGNTVYDESYLYADALDATFFISRGGTACFAFSGYEAADRAGKWAAGGDGDPSKSGQPAWKAVKMATDVVRYMQELIDGQEKGGSGK